MAPKTTSHSVKPLTQRPLDLLYYSFFLMHFICTIVIDCLPLWPAQAQTIPGLSHAYWFFKDVVDGYTAQTNDPFMLATWGLVRKDWEFAHLKLFMWMELFIQLPSFVIGMWGLQKNAAAIYPLLLAYSSCALVTTITVIHGAFILPSELDTTLDPVSKFYSTTEIGRWTVIGPAVPFLIVPAIMWVDMMLRLGRLVKAGSKVEAQKAVANGKGWKEL